MKEMFVRLCSEADLRAVVMDSGGLVEVSGGLMGGWIAYLRHGRSPGHSLAGLSARDRA